jgi:branched-chain amino acid transport system substrate-binding protein
VIESSFLRVVINEEPDTNISLDEIKEQVEKTARQLRTNLNEWLSNSALSDIREEVIEQVSRNEPSRFYIETNNLDLQNIPWEFWNFLEERYNHPEVALCLQQFTQKGALNNPVRILVITGFSTSEDLPILERGLPQARLTPLSQPSPDRLRQAILSQPWDMIFFAGHSCTILEGDDGRFWINDHDYLSLQQLILSLKVAVRNGLKFVFFNSCDGIGLARRFSQLKIPHVIVMRDLVSNRIAEEFLQYFLNSLNTGNSLHQAVREARDRLRLLENDFPSASLLPVIIQNPEELPLYFPSQSIETDGIVTRLKRRLLNLSPLYQLLTLALSGLLLFLLIHQIIPTIFNTDASRVPGISLGEEIILKKNQGIPEIESGSKAFAQRKYAESARNFKLALEQNPNNPEIYIYYNNARAAAFSQQSKKVIKIALSVPLGSNSEVAQEIMRGVALLQNDINDAQTQNHDGYFLQVVVANDDNDELLAQKVAGILIKDRSLFAVVGHNASNASTAAKDIYSQGNLVTITPTSFTEDVSGNAYIFKMVPQMTYFASILSTYVVDTVSQPIVAVCFDPDAPDNKYFKGRFLESLKANRGEFVEVTCDLKNQDFNPDVVVDTIKKNQANSLMIAPHVDRIAKAVEIFKVIAQYQLPVKLFGSPTLSTGKTLTGKEVVAGLTIPVPWFPDENILPSQEFFAKSTRFWDAPSKNWRTPMSYDTAQVIIAGSEKILRSGKTLNSQNLDRVLRSPDFTIEGVTGTIEFDPQTGIRDFSKIQNPSDALIQIQKRGNQFDFVKIR